MSTGISRRRSLKMCNYLYVLILNYFVFRISLFNRKNDILDNKYDPNKNISQNFAITINLNLNVTLATMSMPIR